MRRVEILISVDIEASGPSPGAGSLIAIGACLVREPGVVFYQEVQPVEGLPWDPAAELVHGLTQEHLARDGMPPAEAALRWAAWIDEVVGRGQPVFVGFNAPFDWMFVADLFHRHLGRNPFGISAIDLKAVYLGRHAIKEWAQTSRRHISRLHPTHLPLTHDALDDALSQAELARLLLPSALGTGPHDVDEDAISAPPSAPRGR